jgi:hypothetical protein
MIMGCWGIMQLILVLYLGINAQEESTKYIELSERWIRGERNFNWNEFFYSGYISIHILLGWFGLPIKSMYVIQLFFSGLSVLYFVNILRLYIRSRIVIIGSGLLYATCFFIQQWVTALFTDSIFSSLLIISIYFLLAEGLSSKNKFTCWFLLIILPVFRPVGFLFLLLATFYWIFLAEKRNFLKPVFCILYILLIAIVIKRSLVANPAYFYPYHNTEANIICGYPGNLLQYQKVPYREGMNITTYFTSNPGMSLRLFLFRFVKIFTMTRDYFSPVHNALLAGFSILYFVLAIAGLITGWLQNRRFLFFLLAGIFIFSIPSVVFCQDWSGRFSLPVFCFVLILCGFGIDFMDKYIRSRRAP